MPETSTNTACPRCLKRSELCVCAHLKELPTRLHVLILQHPQEPDKDLGSARLAHLCLPNSTLKIGLSWPNLKKALGRENAQPSRWAVLYLGSGLRETPGGAKKPLHFVTKSGVPVDNVAVADLDGVVILDGTWSQAKALWWRNAWLLKLKRAILTPWGASLYKELRKEPRRECLSTIESIAETLVALGESKETGEQLKAVFAELLSKERNRRKAR